FDPSRPQSETGLALTERMKSLEREVSNERQEVRDTASRAAHLRRDWLVATGVLGAVVLVAIVFGIRLQQTVNRRLDDAASRVAAAERQAATVSDDAARQIASTRASA